MLLTPWLLDLPHRVRFRRFRPSGSRRRSVHRKGYSRAASLMSQFSTRLEILEDRTLMSGQSVASIETIAALFHQSNVHVTSATIVTHGFQSPTDENGDSLMPLAQSIRDRANRENGLGQTAWLLDYDIGQKTNNVSIQGAAAVFDTTESGGSDGAADDWRGGCHGRCCPAV